MRWNHKFSLPKINHKFKRKTSDDRAGLTLEDSTNPASHKRWAFVVLSAAILLFMAAIILAAFFIPRRGPVEVEGHRRPTGFNGASLPVQKNNACWMPAPCEVVCANITQGQPGEIAAEFIRTELTSCFDVTRLTIETSDFPDATLGHDWLPLAKNVQKLKLSHLTVQHIVDGAFASIPFRAPQNVISTLTLDNLRISQLTRNTFDGVLSLGALEIFSNVYLKTVESGILGPLANSLTSFAFNGIDPVATEDLAANFTDNAIMKGIQIYDLRFNPYLTHLTRDIFGGLKYLQSLYFDSLEYIDAGAFQSVRKTIQLIHLADNHLQTLPDGLLDGLPVITGYKYRFQISLAGNPWVCNCSLLWLQDLMYAYDNLTLDEPYCETPTRVRLRDAVMCEQSSVRPPSSTIGTTEVDTTGPVTTHDSTSTESYYSTTKPSLSTTPLQTTAASSTPIEPNPTVTIAPESSTIWHSTPLPTSTAHTTVPPNVGSIKVECIDYSEKHNESILPKREPPETPRLDTSHHLTRKPLALEVTFPKVDDLQIYENADGSVTVDMGVLTGTLILVDMTNVTSTENSCYARASGNVLYRGVKPDTTYTFCLLVGDSKESSPYNCRALTTLPIPSRRTWLQIKDQKVVLGVGVSVAVVCGFLCATGVFLLVRRHPEWLRGSKRVVVVKHRSADVIVLPRGQEKECSSTASSVCQAADPIATSAATVEASCEVTGRVSKTSYISAVEPTREQLFRWRNDRMMARVKRIFDGESVSTITSMGSLDLDVPPPLPPRNLCRRSASAASWESHSGRFGSDEMYESVVEFSRDDVSYISDVTC